jgi:hypothetical protein
LGKPYFGSGKVENIVLNFTCIKLGRLIFCFLTFGKEEEEEEENILGLAKIGKAKNGKTHQALLSITFNVFFSLLEMMEEKEKKLKLSLIISRFCPNI